MSHVTVTINGRQYRMACEDGQENHLIELARDFDRRIIELHERFGEIGDARLTVMAALEVADQLAEAGRNIRRLEEEIASLNDTRAKTATRSQAGQAALVAALNTAAERIERITKSLNQTIGDSPPLG
jgi:cell division protein ZapA